MHSCAIINQPWVYPVPPQKPWVNHFVAKENVHLATIERFVLGSCGVLRGAAISEMEDLQEPKILSRSSPCWRMERDATTSYSIRW